MNTIKEYLTRQASRPFTYLAFDLILIASFVACVYFGWVH